MGSSKSGRYLVVARRMLGHEDPVVGRRKFPEEGYLHLRVWDIETGKCLWRKAWDYINDKEIFEEVDVTKPTVHWGEPTFIRFGSNDEKIIVSGKAASDLHKILYKQGADDGASNT